MKLLWDWCELCEAAFIRCPKCGMNTCSGGYGKINGERCDVCPICHQYEDLAYKTDTEPKAKEDIEYINKKIENIST